MMTYQQLLCKLQTLTEEQLRLEVAVEDEKQSGTFMGELVIRTGYADTIFDTMNFVDDGYPVIVFLV